MDWFRESLIVPHRRGDSHPWVHGVLTGIQESGVILDEPLAHAIDDVVAQLQPNAVCAYEEPDIEAPDDP
jgi:hypothetical protein